MPEKHAPETARHRGERPVPPELITQGDDAEPYHPGCQCDPEYGTEAVAEHEHDSHTGDDAHNECGQQFLQKCSAIVSLPAQQGACAERDDERDRENHEKEIEIGLAHRKIPPPHGVVQNRIDRTHEHNKRDDDKQDVVQEQAALA